MVAHTQQVVSTSDADEAEFELANLVPEDTGLPMVVWVSERGRARHDVRVKVSLVHGDRIRPEHTVSVSVRPTVEVVAGSGLSGHDLTQVRRWIDLNRDAVIAYWDNKLSTSQLFKRLRPLA